MSEMPSMGKLGFSGSGIHFEVLLKLTRLVYTGNLHAAAAQNTGSILVSWDGEHLERAGGMQPTDWLSSRK
jgi:hypothetical protein